MFPLIASGLLALFLRVGACPSSCRCENDRYNCNLNGEISLTPLLNQISAMPSHPTTLNIDMCKPVRTLHRLPSLKVVRLSLSRCWIDAIAQGAFTPLKGTLKELYLSYNGLDNLNWGLHQLEHLRLLNIEHNRIRTVPRLSFYYNPNLAAVWLNNNQISHLSSEAFNKEESRLAFLDLDHNNLQHFPARFLSRKSDIDFSRLLYLCLSNNNFTYIPRNATGNYPHLAFIDLSHNKITSIHPGAFNSLQLKLIDASWNQLTIFNTSIPPSVEVLRLGSNRIESFDITSLAPSARLYADLSNNELAIPGPILDEVCPSSIFFNFEGNSETTSPEAMHCNKIWKESQKTELFITNNRFDLKCSKPLIGCESINITLRYT